MRQISAVLLVLAIAATGCGVSETAGGDARIIELEAQVAALEQQLADLQGEGDTSTTAPTTTVKAATQVSASDVAVEYTVLDESCFN